MTMEPSHLLRKQLEQQTLQTRQALAQLMLVREQLISETNARVEAQVSNPWGCVKSTMEGGPNYSEWVERRRKLLSSRICSAEKFPKALVVQPFKLNVGTEA